MTSPRTTAPCERKRAAAAGWLRHCLLDEHRAEPTYQDGLLEYSKYLSKRPTSLDDFDIY